LLNTKRLVLKARPNIHGVTLLNANMSQQTQFVDPSIKAPRPASAPVVVALRHANSVKKCGISLVLE
jgi:saccharopine dehydrogenase-like NADP-dependent oxidoreductase